MPTANLASSLAVTCQVMVVGYLYENTFLKPAAGFCRGRTQGSPLHI